ncbi:MAG TPA: hypothetical protein VIL46_18960 [Gemmataceae bacterium]
MRRQSPRLDRPGRAAPREITKGSLSPARQHLLERMQSIWFGKIERLVVRGGDPVLDPPPRFVRETKFGAAGSRPVRLPVGDYVVKEQVAEFITYLDRMRDGVIDVLEVWNGLPARAQVTESPD